MTRVEHIIRSVAVPGQPWPKVHDFLDQFFPVMPRAGHRLILHHRKREFNPFFPTRKKSSREIRNGRA